MVRVDTADARWPPDDEVATAEAPMLPAGCVCALVAPFPLFAL